MPTFKRYYKDMMSTAFFFLLFTYIMVPFAFKYYQPFSRRLVFLNMLRWPPFVDFNSPEKLGLEATSNYYLKPEESVKIGLWHTLPNSLKSRMSKDLDSLKSGHPIIMYMHGNAGTRAGWHRIMLYKILSNLNFHVISFDYRGFGDSTGIPTEVGVVQDSLYIYKWLKDLAPHSPIILWGHSLGSGITAKLVKTLSKTDQSPSGVILEAPFTNIAEAASSHPFSRIYRYFPWFTWCFIDPINQNDIYFANDKNMEFINSPLLILHAEDDRIIPFHLGQKLFKIVKDFKVNTSLPIIFKGFDADRKFGHKHIHAAQELPKIIKEFVNEHVLQERQQQD